MGAYPQLPNQSLSQSPQEFKPSMDQPVPTTQCNGTVSATGEQCSRSSIQGSIYCSQHTTAKDQKRAQEVVEAARLRLYGLVDGAVDALQDLTQPGTPEAVRLRAAEAVLDRATLVKGSEVKVEVEHKNSQAELVLDRLNAIRKRTEADNTPEDLEDDTITVEEVQEDSDY